MKSKALWVGLLAVGLADWLLLNVVVGPAYLASAETTAPSPSTAELAAMVPTLAPKDEPAPKALPVEPNNPAAGQPADSPAGDTPPAASAPLDPPSAAVGSPADPALSAPSVDPPSVPKTVDVEAKPTAEPSTEPLLFTRQSAELGEEARRSLKNLSKYLLENPRATLVIEGHADKRGKDEFNDWLSLQRARAVRAYLHGLGVRTEQMRIEARGSNDPVDKSGSEAARAKNRRVELIVK